MSFLHAAVAFCFLVSFKVHGKTSYSKSLHSIAKKTRSMRVEPFHVTTTLPGYSNRVGKMAYRSGIVACLTQLDRGDTKGALLSLKEAMVSLVLFDTTQVYGLPMIRSLIDRILDKYESQFPKALNGLKNYQRLLFDSVVDQTTIMTGEVLTEKLKQTSASLAAVKKQFKEDFGDEVNSFLKATPDNEDLINILSEIKKWSKVKKWSDMFKESLFPAISVAFNLNQLHHGIESADDITITTSSLAIVSSVAGTNSFIAASLRREGNSIGSEGGIFSCLLILAAMAVDVINQNNPNQKISEHFNLVQNLTKTSLDMLNVHYNWLTKASHDDVSTGFSSIYDINEAALIQTNIHTNMDVIPDFPDYRREKITFTPVKTVEDDTSDLLTVGDRRIFDTNHYANWLFKVTDAEETVNDFYGRVITPYQEGGITVRVITDLLSNFWINSVQIKTFENEKESEDRNDNVDIGDFRSIEGFKNKFIEIETGGGDDIVAFSGVICNQPLVTVTSGICLILRMGLGYDVISFEGMDTSEEHLTWYTTSDDLTNTKQVIGIKVDFIQQKVMNRLRDKNGSIIDVKIGEMESVESVIGSPFNDIVVFDDSKEWTIKQSSGDNQYELIISDNSQVNPVRSSIADNSDVAGKLHIIKEGLTLDNVAYMRSTNIILIFYEVKDGLRVIEVLLKRSKPGIENFSIQVNHMTTKSLSDIGTFGMESGLLLPFVPCVYKFDTSLASNVVAMAYIEFQPPSQEYPSTVQRYKIESLSSMTFYILTNELVDMLEENTWTFVAKRVGTPLMDGSWVLELQKDDLGGWSITLGRVGFIAFGVPGYLQILVDLERQDRAEFDVYGEYRTVVSMREFNFEESYDGEDEADKVKIKEPNYRRDDVKESIIDMKGPSLPTPSNRNEIVIPWELMMNLYTQDIQLPIDYRLERENTSAEWHLKVYINWGQRTLLYDVTLRGVHALICDEKFYHWKQIVDLNESQELQHDLVRLLRPLYWQYHGQ